MSRAVAPAPVRAAVPIEARLPRRSPSRAQFPLPRSAGSAALLPRRAHSAHPPRPPGSLRAGGAPSSPGPGPELPPGPRDLREPRASPGGAPGSAARSTAQPGPALPRRERPRARPGVAAPSPLPEGGRFLLSRLTARLNIPGAARPRCRARGRPRCPAQPRPAPGSSASPAPARRSHGPGHRHRPRHCSGFTPRTLPLLSLSPRVHSPVISVRPPCPSTPPLTLPGSSPLLPRLLLSSWTRDSSVPIPTPH